MAEEAPAEKLPTTQSPPDYIGYSTRDRDQFLSQLGTFTPEERNTFHKLCGAWQPAVPFERFVAHVSGNVTDARRTVLSLLAKLNRGRYAVLVSRTDGGELKPAEIVLTNEGDSRFYERTLEETFDQARLDAAAPLPVHTRLIENGIDVPDEYVTPLTTAELSETVASDNASGGIYRISTPGGTQLLVPGSRLRGFTGLAIQRLRFHLSNTNLAAATARILHSSLTQLRQQAGGTEPKFWFSLTGTVLSNRTVLEAQRSVPVSEEFFVAAEFLHSFVDGQLMNARRKKELETRFAADLKTVLTTLSTWEDSVITRERLDQLIGGFEEEYGDRFPAFRAYFFEHALTPPQRKNLGEILELSDSFIHRDLMYPYFLDQLEHLGQVYRERYRKKLADHIRTGSREHRDTFFSREGFVSDVEDQVRADGPILMQLYEEPEAMAEAIVHWAKLQGPIKDIEELKRTMQIHFVPGTTQFYDFPVLLELNLLELFDTAFRTLFPLRQILYRLFGRHETLRSRFIEEAKKAVLPPAPRPRNSRTKRRREESVSYPKPVTTRPKSHPKARPPVSAAEMAKQYTRKDRDRAWDEFRKRIGD